MIQGLAMVILFLASATYPVAKNAPIAPSVSISLEPVFATHYRSWIKEAGSCQNIRHFKSPFASRGTIEAVIICQALEKGGYSGSLNIVTAPNYERALQMALDGMVTMPGESVWEIDIDKSKFMYTEPVIRNGEFEKGIFVLSEKVSEYEIHSLNDLRKLSVASSELWRVDWATIKNMQIRLFNEPTKESMFRTVDAKLADFVLLEFSSLKDLSHTVLGIKLVPIPGIKVILDGNRRFIIPKKTPSADKVHTTLSDGLAILRENGTIDRAWRESGFINTRVHSWKILNPHAK